MKTRNLNYASAATIETNKTTHKLVHLLTRGQLWHAQLKQSHNDYRKWKYVRNNEIEE